MGYGIGSLVERPSTRRRRKQRLVAGVPRWFHSLDLGDGVVTPGEKSLVQLEAEVERIRLPPHAGRSVLDVGTWDGFFAFEAERRGAARVVALDHFIWAIDRPQVDVLLADCGRRGVPLPHLEKVPELWDDRLPGRRGFDLAHDVLGSRVEPMVADFMCADLDSLGVFDVVLFLGVVYHLRDPLLALERLRSVTREVAIIESEANLYDSGVARPLWEFFEGDERAADHTNWWVPNEAALTALCRAAGFRHVETVADAGDASPLASGTTMPYRLVVHAFP